MPSTRVPISNFLLRGDYTAKIKVGPNETEIDVILDTGSSALALDANKYVPDFAGGDEPTDLAQTDSYGDGSTWTGAVITTAISIGDTATPLVLPRANAAVAYNASETMFQSAGGILGLAYAPLDDAFRMPADSWTKKYPADQVRSGTKQDLIPYLTQLEQRGVASDRIAFYTKRSFVRAGNGGAADPLNQGWMVIGDAESSTDLYVGSFQSVKVLSDTWYCTNLKKTIVGDTPAISGRIQGPKGLPSNSIIDSGTNSLCFGPQFLSAIVSKFSADQQSLLNNSIRGQPIPTDALDLESWPTITFIMEGAAGDVRLQVPPENYWQMDAGRSGIAMAAITVGRDGLAILGLPLMNGYFTLFDGEADSGRGTVNFAQRQG